MKLIKNVMLCLFLAIILSVSVWGVQTQIFSEIFSYDDAFDNHDWTYSNGGCGASSEKSTPVFSEFFDSNVFGTNETNGCAFSYSRSIRNDLPINITSGVTRITYNYALLNDSTSSSNTPFILSLRNTSSKSTPSIAFSHNNNSLNTSSDLTGFESCGFSGFTIPYNITESLIEIDLTNNIYSWTVDSQIICYQLVLTTDTFPIQIGSLRLFNQLDSSETMISHTDNIRVYTDESTIGQVPFLFPCSSNDECITKRCVGGYCQKKVGKQSCSSGSECISEQCLNSVCTRPSTWQAMDHEKDVMAGDDRDTNNMIAITVMAFALVAGIVIPAIKGASGSASVFIGILAFYIAGGFFTIVGWLSFFIIFIMVIVLLLLIITVIFLRNHSSQ